MLEHLRNNSDGSLLAFGILRLPQHHKTEYDVIVTTVGLLSSLGILANATLLWVIIKDPCKQLRTNTAILVGFNTFTNFLVSFFLCLERILIWSCRTNILTPQVTIYLGACNANMFFLGSFLHALNCYGTIVIPLRYKNVAPRNPRKMVVFMSILWLINACVFMVIPYVIPKSKILAYIEAIVTLDCVILAVLTLFFIVIYLRIFQTLYQRRKTFNSFHLRRSSQGQLVIKQNTEVAKTLFIHMAYLVFACAPGSIVFMLVLHCSKCNAMDVQLAALFVFPLTYSLFLFHPMLWFCRMTNYRRALKKLIGFKSRSLSRNSTRRGVTISYPPQQTQM